MYSTMDSYVVELPAILAFSPIPQVIYMGWLVGGGGDPHSDKLNNVSSIYISYGPQLILIAANVTKSS